MNYFSIGFEYYTEEELYNTLTQNNITTVVDVRCFPNVDSAKYAKKDLLEPSLKKININYYHCSLLAPSEELLKDYFEDNISWDTYELRYVDILKNRSVETKINRNKFGQTPCFLCLEDKPNKCHRRLALNYLKKKWKDFNIVHL